MWKYLCVCIFLSTMYLCLGCIFCRWALILVTVNAEEPAIPLGCSNHDWLVSRLLHVRPVTRITSLHISNSRVREINLQRRKPRVREVVTHFIQSPTARRWQSQILNSSLSSSTGVTFPMLHCSSHSAHLTGARWGDIVMMRAVGHKGAWRNRVCKSWKKFNLGGFTCVSSKGQSSD